MRVPAEPLGKLFWRFLRFGLLAWGGPVAQIAMIRQELVDEEHWISRREFNRVLGVYQVLPGPEAHELCVYFGMRSRGRLGGFLAGLAFMLPGFLLMFTLSALYTSGRQAPLFTAFFLGAQPAVVALIVRAVHRISQGAIHNRWLWAIAIAAGIAALVGTSFWITLPLSGLMYMFVQRRWHVPAGAVVAVFVVGVLATTAMQMWSAGVRPQPSSLRDARISSHGEARQQSSVATDPPPLQRLFLSGLRAGLLTFGGAYTVLPFLQHDAVVTSRWMTDGQFLDGVALSGILPAPFIIFSTFVGYIGGGPLGALVLTIGIFLPAFSFTLLGHKYVEKLVANERAHAFLDGVIGGVVGLIAATAASLFVAAVQDLPEAALFLGALALLYLWKAKAAVAVVILSAGMIGVLVFR